MHIARTITGMIMAAAVSGTAAAQERIDSRNLNCRQAAAQLQDYGEAVVIYGPGLYKRLVSNVGYCTRSDKIRPVHVPSLDDDQCFIGYRCVARVPPGR